jgi:hypothetical protein
MEKLFGGAISALVIIATAVGAIAPDIWISRDPELAGLDDAARIRARTVARVIAVSFFVLGVLGLCTILAGE